MTDHQVAGPAAGSRFSRTDAAMMAAAVLFALGAALAKGHGSVFPFAVSAIAVVLLAALVGRAVDQLADRLGAGAVGVLQGALGNLPELFICVFALRSGLTDVVTAAIIGSILGNLLLVLGLAFFLGGRRHGVLRFSEPRARMIMSLMILSVAAMLVPSLASYIHAAAGTHEVSLARITAVVLLAVFALSIPASLRREDAPATAPAATPTPNAAAPTATAPTATATAALATSAAPNSAAPTSAAPNAAAPTSATPNGATPNAAAPTSTAALATSAPAALEVTPTPTSSPDAAAASTPTSTTESRWPVPFAITVLALTGLLAAYVSDLFVTALQPAIAALHVSQAFAGLVIVAIAGNAVENAVGVKLALKNQADHALSVVLNSPLQIALVLAPALVLLSPVVGGPAFTLVFNPMLVSTAAVSTLAVAFIVSDGESDWLEGATMVGLYILIAASFWWG